MEHNSFQTFGELLTHLRKRVRLTQAELARAVGYSREQIVRLEKNQRVPDRAAVAAVFTPALDLDDEPELAQRLLELAGHTRQPRSNLPALLTSFIGRAAEVSAVRGYLLDPDKRLITLIGPPGIGKTRLSLQVAQSVLNDFADGVFFVPLAAITDPDFVAQAVVQSLGLVETDQRSLLLRLCEGIGARQMLLVLDNFEHIIDAAPLTAELLRACRNLKIVVTSRESLRVPGEWLYPVPSLTIPAEAQLKTLAAQAIDQFSALQLFAERARAVRPDFALTRANMATVAAICRQLDGLPLAIELITSRIRLMSPQALQTQLTSDFKLHADGMRGVPARQKTLHNAITWSYDLLSREEQSLLARLAVFAGGFTLEAAQAIAQVPHGLNGVMSLLDKSLLVKTIDAQGEIRFSQLEMIRDFALDRLRERDEEAIRRQRHAQFYRALAETAEPHLYAAAQRVWLERLDHDHENLRSALKWLGETDLAAALSLAAALGMFWSMRGYYAEGRGWLTRLLAQYAAPDTLRAKALRMAALLAQQQTDLIEALHLAEESAELYHCGNDAAGEGWALRIRGWTLVDQGEHARAVPVFEEALRLARAAGDAVNGADVLGALVYVQNQIAPDDTLARSQLAESMALYRQLGRQEGIAFGLVQQGLIEMRCGDFVRAVALCAEAVGLFRELGVKAQLMWTLNLLGESRLFQDDVAGAQTCFTEALQLAREAGLQQGIYTTLYHLGQVVQRLGDDAEAGAYFQQSLRLAHAGDDREMLARNLAALGGAALRQAQLERAARLLGAACAQLDHIATILMVPDRREIDQWVAEVRSALDKSTFDKAWQSGQALSIEQAIKLALSERL